MSPDELKRALKSTVHSNALAEILDYAVLPAGKLFRPKLVEAISTDLGGKPSQSSQHLGSAIELHHAYTLVHDDLPSMDNDLIRRGKASTHAKFGEWKAILAGDALLITSFEVLMKIQHPELATLHRLFTWATGARGLILGQYLDLEANGKLNISDVIRVHELKTARLIQVATLGSYLLHRKDRSLRGVIDFLRIGREMGVAFQFLDDLGELTDQKISEHEKMINPFIVSPAEALHVLKTSHERLQNLISRHRLAHTNRMLLNYFKESQSKLELNFQNVRMHLDRNHTASVEKWITTYV